MRWDDVNARARGLAGHLLDRRALERVGGARSRTELVHTLSQIGYPLSAEAGGFDGARLDQWIGDVVAQRFAVLERWLGRRRRVLAVVYEDEERRTLRRLLRGAAQGASPAARLRTLTPTPSLPRRALARLAAVASPLDLARELTGLGHPAGRVLALRGPRVERLGLLGLETALSRLFATRVSRAARGGGRLVRRYTSLLIDLENAWSLLASSGWGPEIGPDDVFLPGGDLLDPDRFRRIALRRDPGATEADLAVVFRGTPLASVIRTGAGRAGSLEGRARWALARWLGGIARLAPLGPAPILFVLERIRLEAEALRAILWSIDLGAPAPVEDWMAAA